MKVIVNVSLKEGVLDPEGQAIKSSLNNLGFEKNIYPETLIPKKVDKKTMIANIAIHINH